MVKKLIVFTLLCGLMRICKYICMVIPSFDLLCVMDVIELKKSIDLLPLLEAQLESS